MDVLRPAVELINFNLNVIKICGFPAFSTVKKRGEGGGEKKKSEVQESAVAVLLSSNRVFLLVLLFWEKSFFFSAALTMEVVGSRGGRVVWGCGVL